MAKIGKTTVDKALRDEVFNDLFHPSTRPDECLEDYKKVNDRQWGIILVDANGEKRYVRISAIVAELRDDMTAEELMQSEIDAYNAKQAEKTEKAAQKAKKILADKAKREEAQYLESEISI